MLSWIPCELHTHTLHSDGSLELKELAQKAAKLGLVCIALTDHNTISGHREIAEAEQASGVRIVPGLEWTTFYGHMVAMGARHYVDWRDKGPGDIRPGIDEIHQAGGLAGIAHPFRAGSPMCTGCYWQYDLEDWTAADYLEVWSENFPDLNPANKRVFQRWTELLDKGGRLTAVSGRDWHGAGDGREYIAVTYLGLAGQSPSAASAGGAAGFTASVLEAMRSGHAVVTMGPLLKLAASLPDGRTGEPGDVLQAAGGLEVRLELDPSARAGLWQLDDQPVTGILRSNLGILLEQEWKNGKGAVSVQLPAAGLRWIRAEAFGSMAGHRCMLAFTNPIYFSKEDDK